MKIMINRKSLETQNVRALQNAAQRLDIAGRTRLGKRSLVQAILKALQEQPSMNEEIAALLDISSQAQEPPPQPKQPKVTPAASTEPQSTSEALHSSLAPTSSSFAPKQQKTTSTPATTVATKEKASPPSSPSLPPSLLQEEGPWTPEALEAQNSRQLQKIARTLDIAGRTRMSKRSLIQSILDFFLARTPEEAETSTTSTSESQKAQASTEKEQSMATSKEKDLRQAEKKEAKKEEKVSETHLSSKQELSQTSTSVLPPTIKEDALIAQEIQASASSHSIAQTLAPPAHTEEDFQDEDDYAARAAAEIAASEALDTSEALQEDLSATQALTPLKASENLAQTVELKPLPRDTVLQPDLEEIHANVEPPPPPPARPSATPYIDRGPTLPERYENTRIRAMIRDPQSVYVYWNTPEPPNAPWKIEARGETGDIVHTFQVPPQYQSGYVRAEVSQIHMIAAHIQPPARPWFPVAAIDLKMPPKRRFLQEPTHPTQDNSPQVSAPIQEEWVRWDAGQAQAHPIQEPPTPVLSTSEEDNALQETAGQDRPFLPSQETEPYYVSAPSSADLQRIPPWRTRTQHPSSPHAPYPPRRQAPSSDAFFQKRGIE